MNMKQKEDINALLARHLAHEAMSAEQQQELEAWIAANTTEYSRLKQLTDARPPQIGEKEFDALQAWQKVEPRLKGRTIELHRKKRFITICSVAASLLLLLATTTVYLFRQPAIHYANDGRTAKHIFLPDSSEVTLFPNTKLSFKYAPQKSSRLAKLEGKAFFQVKKAAGRPFKVETERLEVEVLGTSFLVEATPQKQPGVFVKSGKVKVSAEDSDVILETNEKAELDNGNLQTGIIENPSLFFNLKKAKMVFNQTPLSVVIKEVEKQTGIRIELGKGVDENSITTRIDPEDAENIAAELAFLCGCKCDTLTKGKHYRLYYEKR